MGMPVRIDDQLYEQAKAHAFAERRSISGQVEFWAMVGKAALDNPTLEYLTAFFQQYTRNYYIF